MPARPRMRVWARTSRRTRSSPISRLSPPSTGRSAGPSTRSSAFSRNQGTRHRQLPDRSGDPQKFGCRSEPAGPRAPATRGKLASADDRFRFSRTCNARKARIRRRSLSLLGRLGAHDRVGDGRVVSPVTHRATASPRGCRTNKWRCHSFTTPRSADASGAPLRLSEKCAQLICPEGTDENWCPITTGIRCAGFVRQPPTKAEVSKPSAACHFAVGSGH